MLQNKIIKILTHSDSHNGLNAGWTLRTTAKRLLLNWDLERFLVIWMRLNVFRMPAIVKMKYCSHFALKLYGNTKLN